MKVFSPPHYPASKTRRFCVATLGIFDGLHKGHIYILRKVVQEAKRTGAKSLLVSLSPHPASFYNQRFCGYITTQQEKISLLESMGLDYFWVIKFNKRIARMKGEAFLNYLLRYFDIKKIIVARDFRFGHKAENTVKDLERICAQERIGLGEIRKRRLQGTTISSSFVRRLIRAGNFKKVSVFLGRPYSIRGKVIRGKGVGEKFLGTPTVNLDADERTLPPSGVYITKLGYKNKVYKSISNLAVSNRRGKKKSILETHIFDFNKNIRGKVVEVTFIKRLRPEKRFPTRLALKAQIKKDIEACQAYFFGRDMRRLP